MSDIMRIQNLSVQLRREKRTLVDSISFSVEAKQPLIILGESGSGKTMTCSAIMNLLDAKRFAVSGEMIYQGRNLLDLSVKDRRALYGNEIAFIPQNPMTAFDPSMKIGKQMVETLRIHSGKRAAQCRQIAMEALLAAGLSENVRVFSSYPHELSGGMLQRVMIAMVLMTQAKLVIADEPTTALDVVHRNESISAFRRLVERGTTVIMVTHDFAAAVQLGGKLLIMHSGKIIERGTVADVFQHPQAEYTRSLIGASTLSVRLKEAET